MRHANEYLTTDGGHDPLRLMVVSEQMLGGLLNERFPEDHAHLIGFNLNGIACADDPTLQH